MQKAWHLGTTFGYDKVSLIARPLHATPQGLLLEPESSPVRFILRKNMMAAEKRPASNAFGSSQLVVKRQKSNVDLSDGKAVTVNSGNAAGGALVQAVSLP